jgi:hypothetical protein
VAEGQERAFRAGIGRKRGLEGFDQRPDRHARGIGRKRGLEDWCIRDLGYRQGIGRKRGLEGEGEGEGQYPGCKSPELGIGRKRGLEVCDDSLQLLK